MSSKTHQKNFPTLFLSMYIFQIIYFRQGIINLFPPPRCLIYFRTKHLKIFRKFRKEQARNFEFEILNTILIDFWSSIIIPDFLLQCILRFVTPRFVPSFFLATKIWQIGGCTVFYFLLTFISYENQNCKSKIFSRDFYDKQFGERPKT